MSRRLLVGTGAAALALVLAAPTAALAEDGKTTNNGNHAGSGSAAAPAGDPAGNNGTIKVDFPPAADSGHANRPHPSCSFQVRMFNFDKAQYGTITFTGQAPTKMGTLLTQQHVLLSDDRAGGGKDVDAVYSYTPADLHLAAPSPGTKGWHIKVAVDADNAPGGAKQKVFWLACPAPPAADSGSTAEQSTAQQNSVTTNSFRSGTTAGATRTATTSDAAASRTLSAGSRRVPAVTGFTGGSATAASTTGRSAASTPGRGRTLPFTGFALGALLALALGALAAGALAIRAGRRTTS